MPQNIDAAALPIDTAGWFWNGSSLPQASSCHFLVRFWTFFARKQSIKCQKWPDFAGFGHPLVAWISK
ncbi:MAG: hypothetical protein ABSG51_00155 [Terracidiphilus sp.]